jgi:pyruvate,water dikinase
VIGGRPYLNISIFATLYYGLGRNQQDLLNYMESTLYMNLPEGLLIPSIRVSCLTMLRGMFSSLMVQLKQKRGVKLLTPYLASNKTWFRDIRNMIQTRETQSGLYDLWYLEMVDHIKKGVWCVLGSVTHSAEYMMELRRQLNDLVGPGDASILIANLGEEDAPLESLGPVAGLEKLASGEISMNTYLDYYGHRGPHEFELSRPRPAEDPTWLEQELKFIRGSPMDVEWLVAKQRRSFKAAWGRLQAKSPRKARHFNRKIVENVRRARLRERARSAYTRDRWAIRLFAIRAGELTGLGDQVFYLSLDELLELLSGDRSVIGSIQTRRDTYQQYKTLPPFPSVIQGPFDPFTWAADPDRPTDIYIANETDTQRSDPDLLVGSPGSAGVVEGIVRVVDHPGMGGHLQHGDILVAIQTDIAWTLLFPRAGAVVTDIGAPLSHAAIVARELGIPAVVGCGNATAVLNTGDRVRVDGTNGLVDILERGS